jgi:hypothetical protein
MVIRAIFFNPIYCHVFLFLLLAAAHALSISWSSGL